MMIKIKNDKLIKIKKAIKSYCDGKNIDIDEFGIHSIKLKHKYFDKTEVIIYLKRPGLFIGQAGKQIKAIHSYVENEICEKLEFKVIEDDPFLLLYSNPCSR